MLGNLSPDSSIAIFSGASTPNITIEDVKLFIEKFVKSKNISIEFLVDDYPGN